MKKVLLSLLIIGSFWQLSAQQDAQFTHYMFNTLAVNPGYAGSRDALTITGLHRSQWVGFPGTPKTQTLTVHTPLTNSIGAGLSFLNDKIGPVRTTTIYGDFSYKIPVGKKGSLALGLKGGVNIRRNDLAELATNDLGDNSFSSNISETLPNFGFGLYYSRERFYAGLSTPRLLESEIESSSNAVNTRHYFFIAGGVINISKTSNIKLKPTTFVKITEAAPLDVDLTATFLFSDKFWIGPAYRVGDGFGALIGYYFTPQLAVGYSFDWSVTNETSTYNDGSHEVMLRYDFIYGNKRKIKSPRYF